MFYNYDMLKDNLDPSKGMATKNVPWNTKTLVALYYKIFKIYFFV